MKLDEGRRQAERIDGSRSHAQARSAKSAGQTRCGRWLRHRYRRVRSQQSRCVRHSAQALQIFTEVNPVDELGSMVMIWRNDPPHCVTKAFVTLP